MTLHGCLVCSSFIIIRHHSIVIVIPHSSPELVPAVDGLLFQTEDDRSEVLILREVVPVFRAVKVLLKRLLFDRGEFKRAILLKVLLDGCFLAVWRSYGRDA